MNVCTERGKKGLPLNDEKVQNFSPHSVWSRTKSGRSVEQIGNLGVVPLGPIGIKIPLAFGHVFGHGRVPVEVGLLVVLVLARMLRITFSVLLVDLALGFGHAFGLSGGGGVDGRG